MRYSPGGTSPDDAPDQFIAAWESFEDLFLANWEARRRYLISLARQVSRRVQSLEEPCPVAEQKANNLVRDLSNQPNPAEREAIGEAPRNQLRWPPAGYEELLPGPPSLPSRERSQAPRPAGGGFADQAVLTDPGAVFSFSRYDYPLALHALGQFIEGDVVAAASRRVFEPLGMEHTSLGDAAGVQIFPEAGGVFVFWSRTRTSERVWPSVATGFLMEALGSDLGVGREILEPRRVRGDGQFEKGPRPCEEPIWNSVRPSDPGSPAPPGDRAGRYLNGDRVFELQERGGVLFPYHTGCALRRPRDVSSGSTRGFP
jgi:hypothetical protein